MRTPMLALGLLLLGASALARPPEVGDVVWAEWERNAWYHGKVDGRCDGGLHVLFDDNDKACVKMAGLALDRVPEPEDIRVGARVLARWDDGRFYPGTVKAIRGSNAQIGYDDGDTGAAGLGDLRLIAGSSAAPAPPPKADPAKKGR